MTKLMDSKYAWGVVGMAAGMALYHFVVGPMIARPAST